MQNLSGYARERWLLGIGIVVLLVLDPYQPVESRYELGNEIVGSALLEREIADSLASYYQDAWCYQRHSSSETMSGKLVERAEAHKVVVTLCLLMLELVLLLWCIVQSCDC